MSVSIRSYLTAGAAAMVVGATAITPVQPSTPTSITAHTVRLSAAVQPLVNQVTAAAATLGQNAPAAAPQQPQVQKTAQANNNASDAIDAAYNVIMYWGDYWANQLGPYLLGWVPFGYLISDQIQIWYNTFTVPVSYSFVYDFLDPVVNDFWNPAVWRNGLTALANTTGFALGQTFNAEVAYIVSLQWFPFPLPPLPPLPFAATKVPAAVAARTTSAGDDTSGSTEKAKPSGTGHSARPRPVQQATEAGPTDPPTDTSDIPDASGTTDSATATAASTPTTPKSVKTGKSGSAESSSGTAKKSGTAGSARTPKADKAAK